MQSRDTVLDARSNFSGVFLEKGGGEWMCAKFEICYLLDLKLDKDMI